MSNCASNDWGYFVYLYSIIIIRINYSLKFEFFLEYAIPGECQDGVPEFRPPKDSKLLHNDFFFSGVFGENKRTTSSRSLLLKEKERCTH